MYVRMYMYQLNSTFNYIQFIFNSYLTNLFCDAGGHKHIVLSGIEALQNARLVCLRQPYMIH